MRSLTKIRSVILALCGVAALILTVPAFAQQGGYPGYYGYRGWYGGYYYPWGWSGPGPYFAARPYYYPTYWYGGSPYYSWGPAVVQYRTVARATGGRRPVWSEVIVYPKNGQSEYQHRTDRYECYRWAISQLGYDPTSAGGGTVRRDLTDYNRAQTACLTARGYSVQ
jgi:hypothetical protein